MDPVKATAPEPPQEAEALSLARDWEGQFNTLKSAIEAEGYSVGYGDHGQPVVSKAV